MNTNFSKIASQPRPRKRMSYGVKSEYIIDRVKSYLKLQYSDVIDRPLMARDIAELSGYSLSPAFRVTIEDMVLDGKLLVERFPMEGCAGSICYYYMPGSLVAKQMSLQMGEC